MKTMTIRDIRQRWPQAEKALALEGEIIITRDGKPVAKLVRVEEAKDTRPCFDFEELRRWQEKTFGKKVFHVVDQALAESRADRDFFPTHKKAHKK